MGDRHGKTRHHEGVMTSYYQVVLRLEIILLAAVLLAALGTLLWIQRRIRDEAKGFWKVWCLFAVIAASAVSLSLLGRPRLFDYIISAALIILVLRIASRGVLSRH